MKAVLDTNIWVSGLLWGGPPGQIILLAESRQLSIIASETLLMEIETTLTYSKLQPKLQQLNETLESLSRRIRQLVEVYPIASLSVASLRDPDDTVILATAIAASANAIVTGDRDLLTLAEFAGIPIMTPQAFLNRYSPPSKES